MIYLEGFKLCFWSQTLKFLITLLVADLRTFVYWNNHTRLIGNLRNIFFCYDKQLKAGWTQGK